MGTALAVLTAGTELSLDPPRVDAVNLVAAAPPGTDGERDDCTASAGFWGAVDGTDAERGDRRMVCKRYA